MLRAWQTAEIFARVLLDGKPRDHIVSYDALAERSLGCMANLTTQEIEDMTRNDPRFDAAPLGWKSLTVTTNCLSRVQNL